MPNRVTPMLRVADIRRTIAWYASLGFSLVSQHDDDGEIDWALMSFGEGRVMLNRGGDVSPARRDVDLYVHLDGIDEVFARLAPDIEVIEPPHDTFYGMRELIVRDPSGYWVTFGEPLSR